MENKIVKFRVYSHQHKKIFELCSIEFGESEQCEGCNILIGNRESEWLNYGTFDLLQFTGLKDKHKKEIYEGHLIKDLTNDIVFAVHWIKNGLRFGKTILIGSGKGQTTSLSDLYNDVSKTPNICDNIEIIGDVFSKN